MRCLLLEEKVPNFVRRMRWKCCGHIQCRRWCALYPTTPHPSRRTAAPPSPQGEGLKNAQQILSLQLIPSEAGLAPSGSPAALSHNSAATDSPQTATTPQAEACGVTSAYPQLFPSEAGLAPSGSPAVLSHCSAATDSPQNSDNPAGRSLRGYLSMTPQTRRSIFLNWDAGELRLGQITPTALPSSRQTAS